MENESSEHESPPGVKNGIIVDAAYWHWVDAQREASQQEQTS